MKRQNRDFNKKNLLSIIQRTKPLRSSTYSVKCFKELGPILMIDHFLPQFLLIHGRYYFLIVFNCFLTVIIVYFLRQQIISENVSWRAWKLLELQNTFLFNQLWRMKRTNVVGLSQRKRIKTEETAKVVESVWGR